MVRLDLVQRTIEPGHQHQHRGAVDAAGAVIHPRGRECRQDVRIGLRDCLAGGQPSRGNPRGAATTARIGFHAASDQEGTDKGGANALVGAFLKDIGLSYEAILYITKAPPKGMQWLNFDDAKRLGIDVLRVTPEQLEKFARPATPPPPSEQSPAWSAGKWDEVVCGDPPPGLVVRDSSRLEHHAEVVRRPGTLPREADDRRRSDPPPR